MLKLVDVNVILYKRSHLCSMMPKKPIEILLVKVEPLSKTLLQCVTSNITLLSNVHSFVWALGI